MMVTRSAWDAFQTGVEPELAPELLTSWRRSQWSGVDPLRTEISIVDVDTDSPFVRMASPILQRVAGLLGGKVCLALADSAGRILWRWVSDALMARDLGDHHMLEGGAFSEERIGTNGIGTALESRSTAVVVGAAHFVEAFHPWACVAAPIIHPVTQRVHGAINITCYSSDANQFLKAMVCELAEKVSKALLQEATLGERRLFDAYVQARLKTSAPIVAVNRHTMIVDDVASTWNLNHEVTWQKLRDEPDCRGMMLSTSLYAKVGRIADTDGAVLELYPMSGVEHVPTERSSWEGRSSAGPLERAEAAVIAETLNACKGNKSLAATQLGISRATLYQRLRRYRIEIIREGPPEE